MPSAAARAHALSGALPSGESISAARRQGHRSQHAFARDVLVSNILFARSREPTVRRACRRWERTEWRGINDAAIRARWRRPGASRQCSCAVTGWLSSGLHCRHSCSRRLRSTPTRRLSLLSMGGKTVISASGRREGECRTRQQRRPVGRPAATTRGVGSLGAPGAAAAERTG